jgi:hypothetical protein
MLDLIANEPDNIHGMGVAAAEQAQGQGRYLKHTTLL